MFNVMVKGVLEANIPYWAVSAYPRAISTPTPSLGKNVAGGRSLHLPAAIQVLSTSTSLVSRP
jgi:hypothetical protein